VRCEHHGYENRPRTILGGSRATGTNQKSTVCPHPNDRLTKEAQSSRCEQPGCEDRLTIVGGSRGTGTSGPLLVRTHVIGLTKEVHHRERHVWQERPLNSATQQ
jgi:hypothetical protein